MQVKLNVAGTTFEGEVAEAAMADLVAAGVRAIILNTVPRADETRDEARDRAFREAISGERFGSATNGSQLKAVLEEMGVNFEQAVAKIMESGVSEATALRTLRNHPKVLAKWPLPSKADTVKIEGLSD